jgi:hypothetical protein
MKGVAEIIGEAPNTIYSGDVMEYFDKGFNIQFDDVSDTDKRKCIYGFFICYNDNGFHKFKKFKGNIIPPLSDKETKDTILNKFGKPGAIWGHLGDPLEDFLYERKYGILKKALQFGFDKGDLVYICIW